jgi:uncharacterized membrane protein
MNQIKRIIHSTIGKALVLATVALTLAGGTSAAFDSQKPSYLTYTQIDFPEAMITAALGINNAGKIVGVFLDSMGNQHGFVMEETDFTQIDVPNAASTLSARGINDAEQIVIPFIDSSGFPRGALLDDGVFSPIDVQAVGGSGPHAINNRGEIVGFLVDGNGLAHGYRLDLDNGNVIQIDFPGALETNAIGINNGGDIVGEYRLRVDAPIQGFLLRDGIYTKIDFPGSMVTQVSGINDAGQIVGDYEDPLGLHHGYLWEDGEFKRVIDIPDSLQTQVLAINDVGQIVGIFVSVDGRGHGFVMNTLP